MSDFQLILLSDVERTARKRAPGAFSLIPFQSYMGSALPPPGLATNPNPESPWLLPGEALRRVIDAIGDYTIAVETILGRLTAGLLKATYDKAKWENTSRTYQLDPNFIAPDNWKHYKRSHESSYVWKTGDLRLYIGSMSSMHETSVYLTFFHVKIERQGIDKIVANAAPPATQGHRLVQKAQRRLATAISA